MRKKSIEEVLNGLVGETFDTNKVEAIAKEHGTSVEWGDSGIDDGLDCEDEDDGDVYLLYQSCDIKGETIDLWVKFYYGDNSYEITDIEIYEE